MKTEKEAQKKAEELCERLTKNLDGVWIPEVWYNMYWCCRAVLKNGSIGVSFSKSREKYYSSMTDTIGEYSATPAFWADSKSYDTPEEAVLNQVEKALKVSERIQKVVTANMNALKETK